MEQKHTKTNSFSNKTKTDVETCSILLQICRRFCFIVKGTKVHAEFIREECRCFLENKQKLALNMEKTHITHVNDGFTFLGHRIIRKRGSRNIMRPVTTIPKEKFKN